jgi:hypothetical protein
MLVKTMNTRTHKDKVKKARKMQTPLERKLHVPLFDSAEWMKRKQTLQTKQISKYMSLLGSKGGKMNTKENLDKARARSLEVRRANAKLKQDDNTGNN